MLRRRARKFTSPYYDVIRAKIGFVASQGFSNEVIAMRLDTPRQVVSYGVSDIAPGHARGRATPPFSPGVVVEVKALACDLPARRGFPLAGPDLHRVASRGDGSMAVAEISDMTLWRWLGDDALGPRATAVGSSP